MNTDYELMRSLIIVTAALNSCAVERLTNRSMDGRRRRLVAIYVGGSVYALFLLSSVITAALKHYLLEPIGFELSHRLLVILCVSALTAVTRLLPVWGTDNKYGNLVFISALVLTALMADVEADSFLRNITGSLVVGGYFVPAMVLFSRLRLRIDDTECARGFAPLPVMLLSGAFFSLALSGIMGIVGNALG